MSKKKNVLVAGANGSTGRIIIDLLKKSENHQPIAMVRKPEQKEHFEKENVTAVLADLEEDLNQAVKGADKVIFAAGSGGNKVVEVDQEGAKRLIDAAKNAGVEKFVMLSSMGAGKPEMSEELGDYLEAKGNADDYLQKSGLTYTIVRPGALTDDDGSGKIQLKKKLEKQESISRANVARTLVEVLDDDVKQNQIFEILDGETLIEKAVRD
ncbi:NAD-dependent dehydratase [Salegentibacter salinarum]|uniref:NAD-dependent dehydratase n=1 Tax=Salegentibacter salinarum TaxID=447422 RepID=A0A2N0TSM9_9FLAO|nr:SDR family oxidoreductase [Salegentibacter salinarum]PKD17741.1 NAD-dependent dehydratase [Salegentibacter salinarum]